MDRAVIEMFNPFMDFAIKDMKSLGLKPDQAVVAMVINIANTFQREGAMQRIRTDRYDMFINFLRLYHAACLMLDNERYHRASLLYDSNVFRALSETD